MQTKTGLLPGKENVEQHVEPETLRLSEHGMKVREAREARRKRILARSSERLAFITGEANAIPTSPLLSHDHAKTGNTLVSLASLLNQDPPQQCSPVKKPTIKKSLSFHDHDEAHKEPVNIQENTHQEHAEVAECPKTKSTEAMEALKEQQAHVHVTFQSVSNTCIKQSLLPRLVSAACIALAFLASGFPQGRRYSLAAGFPAMFGYAQRGHFGGSDVLAMMRYVLASVILADLALFVGAFFFCGRRELLKVMRNKEAVAEQATLSIVLHLLFSMSVDCSISASIFYVGGFLVVPKAA